MKNIKKVLCNKFYVNGNDEKELNCEEGYRLIELYFPLEMYDNDNDLIDTVCNFICYEGVDCYYYDGSQYKNIKDDYFEFSICVDDEKIKEFNKKWIEIKKVLKTEYLKQIEEKNNTWTKEKIKDLLLNNDKAVLKGIIVIYEFQTEDEKIIYSTNTLNGVGFNHYDSEILSSFAEQILRNRNLSEKQMNIARKKIIKYAGQLANVANFKNRGE